MQARKKKNKTRSLCQLLDDSGRSAQPHDEGRGGENGTERSCFCFCYGQRTHVQNREAKKERHTYIECAVDEP